MTAQEKVSQRAVTRSWVPRLTLVPPLADPVYKSDEPFLVSGSKEINDRCREWALRNRYFLASGIDACAHGLYMLECAWARCLNGFNLDHGNIWVPASFRDCGSPFILAHPYVVGGSGPPEVPDRLRVYAEAHGLDLSIGSEYGDAGGDDWYAPGETLPIRLTIPRDSTVWPIEEQALVLMAVRPMDWPGDEDQ